MREISKEPEVEEEGLLHTELSIGGVSLTKKVLFARNLSVMIRAGLTVSEALDIAASSARGALRRILNEVLTSVRSGNSLAASLGEHPHVFSPLFISSVYVGESSGTLSETLQNVSEELEKERNLIAKIRGAMIYPTVVFVAALMLGVLVSVFILPQITPLFKSLTVDLPFTTRILISFSDFVTEHTRHCYQYLLAVPYFLYGSYGKNLYIPSRIVYYLPFRFSAAFRVR